MGRRGTRLTVWATWLSARDKAREPGARPWFRLPPAPHLLLDGAEALLLLAEGGAFCCRICGRSREQMFSESDRIGAGPAVSSSRLVCSTCARITATFGLPSDAA